MHPNVHNSNTYNSHDMEATQMPIKWMNKEYVVEKYKLKLLWGYHLHIDQNSHHQNVYQ